LSNLVSDIIERIETISMGLEQTVRAFAAHSGRAAERDGRRAEK